MTVNTLRYRVAAGLSTAAIVLGAVPGTSAGDLQSQIDAGKAAAGDLQSQISADNAQIAATSNGLRQAEARLAALQAELSQRESQLRAVQSQLLAARAHLLELENRMQLATQALAANLVANYEGARPDVVTTVLEARGFKDLLEKVDFLKRIGQQDAAVVSDTRAARAQVTRQADQLAVLEARNRRLTDQVLAQRTSAAALQEALLSRQIAETQARAGKAAQLGAVKARLHGLEAKQAAEQRAAAAAAAAAAARIAADSGIAPSPGQVSGIGLYSGGMVQPPPGAPAAVAQVIAAGNAIATLPYIWGGGHGSFQANGYDCSGSVSYALAAAGLLSSPLDSTGFESWGLPGPGRWITVYANAEHAWMEVAGWRFDTVAQAESGTRWAQGGGEFAGMVERHPPGL